MRYTDFHDRPAGLLVPTLDGAMAFVPNPLPPALDMAVLALPLAAAKLAVGELRGASRNLPNPYLFIAPLQKREAMTSSAMEGTHTTAQDLMLAVAGINKSDPDTAEVSNYIKALRAAVAALTELPISHRLIRDAHRTLLTNAVSGRGANKRPGEYKIEQNWIGGATVAAARFVPPPPAQSQIAMDALEAWINRATDSRSDPLIDMALAHYQFEAIHPFADGNGRLGRLIVTLMAMTTGLLRDPILYLSPVIEQRKDEYIDRMYAVSANGAWEDWICFFCDVVAESCRQTIDTIDRVLALKADFAARVRAKSNSANDPDVLEMLFREPVLRIADVKDRLDVSTQGARNVIDRLIGSGILKELPGWYPKVFYAPDIILIADRQSVSRSIGLTFRPKNRAKSETS